MPTFITERMLTFIIFSLSSTGIEPKYSGYVFPTPTLFTEGKGTISNITLYTTYKDINNFRR